MRLHLSIACFLALASLSTMVHAQSMSQAQNEQSRGETETVCAADYAAFKAQLGSRLRGDPEYALLFTLMLKNDANFFQDARGDRASALIEGRVDKAIGMAQLCFAVTRLFHASKGVGDLEAARANWRYWQELIAKRTGGTTAAAGAKPPAASPSAQAPQAKAAAASGQWPAGVQPGNLYALEETERVQYVGSRPSGPPITQIRALLVAASSPQEALRTMEEAYERYKRDEGKGMQIYPSYVVSYRVIDECKGANWGATIVFVREQEVKYGWSCGLNTPEAAIRLAASKCAERAGRPCVRQGPQDRFLSVSIGHSASEGFAARDTKYPAGAMRWPPREVTHTALWASTVQSDSGQNVPESAEVAISQFGRACADGTRSCWVTSKNLKCILNEVPVKQSSCIDRDLTAAGYRK